MSTVDKDINNNNSTIGASICANCGKQGSDINNICNKCKQVKYCNAACKKKHKKKHKKACDKLVAEQHDEKLFKQPPPLNEDCPICFIQLPSLNTGRRYMSCCGKLICSGCIHAPVYDNQGNEVGEKKCPFCRTKPPDTEKEMIKREKERVDAGDAMATHNLGICYNDGSYGYQQDYAKALELYHRAAELGFAKAYNNIGNAYDNGEGVEVDKEKAMYYYELSAIGGNAKARHNLGYMEANTGNVERAVRHLMIATRDGQSESLNSIKRLYTNGHAPKEDYTKALQAYQEYLLEIKSEQRDKAAAAHAKYRYY